MDNALLVHVCCTVVRLGSRRVAWLAGLVGADLVCFVSQRRAQAGAAGRLTVGASERAGIATGYVDSIE